ncbi:archease [Halosegnis rubeus]|uniref:Archease n=1 Tax=Halosegnis rubeus TaxID=2212850 RepID=A0A5N5UIK3_9EURY|nr:archease [Halosegnis rubeus]KAB7518331.1 archease [Halosegnis rubeus]
MTGRFELRDHTADVAVAARGSTLDTAFAATADGLTAAMCDDYPPGGDRFELAVRESTLETLLFSYLDELIYQRDVRGVLPCDHAAAVTGTADEWEITASARGLPLDAVAARGVKAVTYSQLSVARTDDGWETYVVFDV